MTSGGMGEEMNATGGLGMGGFGLTTGAYSSVQAGPAMMMPGGDADGGRRVHPDSYHQNWSPYGMGQQIPGSGDPRSDWSSS
jgi:hypothetical protein